MATYTNSGNFSSGSTERYRLDVTVVTTPVSGGMQLNVSATATLFNATGLIPAFSASGSRTYSVPNGRTISTSGTLTPTGSATWSYDFGANPTQTVWSGFNRFIASGSGNTATARITATGSGSSFLGTADVTVSNISLLNSYSINYNANGGSGSISSTTTSTTNDSATLTAASSSGFSRSGYNFTGWNTASNGTGTAYGVGSGVSLSYSSPSITLYAQWELAAYTVSYNANGGFVSPSSATVNVGSSTTLPTPTRSGYQFSGWYTATSGGTYVGGAGSSYTPPSSITIYAQWESTVVFNANGGTVSANGSSTYTLGVPAGISVTFPSASRSGFSFNGWYSLPSGGTYQGTSGTTVTPAGSITYYAQWSALSVVWTDDTLILTARKGTAYYASVTTLYTDYWSDGALPSKGLSFTGGSNLTGSSVSYVSGAPNDYGSLSFTLTPYNSDNDAGPSRSYTIQIADEALSWSDQILASSVVVQNESYLDGVSVNPGPTATYSIASGALPPGISLNSTTGALSGTPTTPGQYTFTVRATNGTGETLTTNSLTITVETAGGYVQVRTASGWQNAIVYVKTAGGWIEGTVNAKSPSGWGTSFSS